MYWISNYIFLEEGIPYSRLSFLPQDIVVTSYGILWVILSSTGCHPIYGTRALLSIFFCVASKICVSLIIFINKSSWFEHTFLFTELYNLSGKPCSTSTVFSKAYQNKLSWSVTIFFSSSISIIHQYFRIRSLKICKNHTFAWSNCLYDG